MALDNAQFISELSITDPPGTDAVAEGDDHIRTTKRATQQSFPNVDAAVPQTAAQMGQMAIKNEVNTFLASNTFEAANTFNGNDVFNGFVSFFDSPAIIAPSAADFSGIRLRDETGVTRWFLRRQDTTTGLGDFEIRRNSAAGGLQSTPIRLLASNGQIHASSGSAAQPQYSFQSATNSGMYRDGANAIGFSTGGVRAVGIDTVTSIWSVTLRGPDGLAIAPTYSWSDATDLGMYHEPASNVIAWATGGVLRMRLSTSQFRIVSLQMAGAGGSAASPFYSFTGNVNMGMFSIDVNRLGFSAGSVKRFEVKSNTLNMTLPTTSAGLGAGDLWRSGGFVAIVP